MSSLSAYGSYGRSSYQWVQALLTKRPRKRESPKPHGTYRTPDKSQSLPVGVGGTGTAMKRPLLVLLPLLLLALTLPVWGQDRADATRPLQNESIRRCYVCCTNVRCTNVDNSKLEG
jgi:hypothetical protein